MSRPARQGAVLALAAACGLSAAWATRTDERATATTRLMVEQRLLSGESPVTSRDVGLAGQALADQLNSPTTSREVARRAGIVPTLSDSPLSPPETPLYVAVSANKSPIVAVSAERPIAAEARSLVQAVAAVAQELPRSVGAGPVLGLDRFEIEVRPQRLNVLLGVLSALVFSYVGLVLTRTGSGPRELA